jgi:TonB family protein
VRDERLAGVAFSVALHVVIVGLILYLGGPGSTYTVKRGEPLFVELPEIDDRAPRGNPAARTPGPPATAGSEPTPPRAAAPPAPTPPAPRAQPPATPPPPRVAEARPKAPEPPRAARARPPEPVRSAPPAEKPAPKPPEPPAADVKDALPVPVQPERAEPTPPAPAPPTPAAPAVAAPPTPIPPASAPATPASPSSRGGAPQVASIPPGPREPVFDLRSFGRGGGAGGRGEGRGGIEGEPIPLDSRDPKYSDYLDRIRRMIKERWGYPCVKTRTGCDYMTAELVIEFGIAKDGRVPFVNLVRTSGYPIYDDYALNAIRLASPFPPVPDSLSKKGFPIMARFHYVVDRSLVNTLR